MNYSKILPIATLFLFLDISIFTLFGNNIAALLLCFYTIILFRRPKITILAFIIFLMSVQHFLLYGQIKSLIIYLIPLSFLASTAQKHLRKSNTLPYLFAALCIAIDGLAIEPYIFGVKINFGYTFCKICANLLVVAIFLKFLPKGKLGNRL